MSCSALDTICQWFNWKVKNEWYFLSLMMIASIQTEILMNIFKYDNDAFNFVAFINFFQNCNSCILILSVQKRRHCVCHHKIHKRQISAEVVYFFKQCTILTEWFKRLFSIFMKVRQYQQYNHKKLITVEKCIVWCNHNQWSPKTCIPVPSQSAF